MTVNKITSPITPLELIDKTNEIIDNLGGSAPSNMVTTDTVQTISGNKTFSGTLNKRDGNDIIEIGGSNKGLTFNSMGSAKDWVIKSSGYTASTFSIKDFKTTTFQAGNTSSNSNLVLSHNSAVFNKSDGTSVDLLAGYQLPTASTTDLGGVKVDGTTITIDSNGVISSSGGGGTSYTAGGGIDITNNEISVKTDRYSGAIGVDSNGYLLAYTDGLTTGVNAFGQLEVIGLPSGTLSNYVQKTDIASTSSAGVVKIDGTTITISNGVISASSSAPSNMVTTDTTQDITGNKTFKALTYFGTDNPITISASKSGANRFSKIKGSAPVNHLTTQYSDQRWGFDRDPVFTNGTTGGESSVPANYQPYLRYGNITSTGGTVTITNNGANGINLEASGGSTPTYDSTNERITW